MKTVKIEEINIYIDESYPTNYNGRFDSSRTGEIIFGTAAIPAQTERHFNNKQKKHFNRGKTNKELKSTEFFGRIKEKLKDIKNPPINNDPIASSYIKTILAFKKIEHHKILIVKSNINYEKQLAKLKNKTFSNEDCIKKDGQKGENHFLNNVFYITKLYNEIYGDPEKINLYIDNRYNGNTKLKRSFATKISRLFGSEKIVKTYFVKSDQVKLIQVADYIAGHAGRKIYNEKPFVYLQNLQKQSKAILKELHKFDKIIYDEDTLVIEQVILPLKQYSNPNNLHLDNHEIKIQKENFFVNC